MTQPGLLHQDVMRAEVVNRQHPAPSLLPAVADGLRWAGRTLMEIAEAMLRPESETRR